MARPLVLYARGRWAGQVACGLAAVATACVAIRLLTSGTEALLAVMAPLAAVSLLGFALGAADPALERATPRRRSRWRAAELGVCAVAGGVALLPALVPADAHAGAALRNLAGLGGLTALGAAAVGARRAWLVPTAWAFAGAAVGPRAESWLDPLTWPVQPEGTGVAFAVVLAVAGALVHARYGPRASPPSTV
jgi:hypothetical protein